MREYEVVYIFRPEMESEDVDSALDGYHERLDGEITAVEHWGTRQLAYEIDDERSGYYVVAQFRADPASLSGFEQALDMDEELIRHLIVLSEGEMPVPPSQRREDEKEEDEDEDEDEDDDEDEDEEEDGKDEDEDDVEDEDEDEEDDEGEDEDNDDEER